MEKPQHFDLEGLEIVSLKLLESEQRTLKKSLIHKFVNVENTSNGSKQITVTEKNANCF